MRADAAKFAPEPDKPKVIPMLGNLHTPHVWTLEKPGGVCRRCGALYGDKESCP
jgi:hypothetical protein